MSRRRGRDTGDDGPSTKSRRHHGISSQPTPSTSRLSADLDFSSQAPRRKKTKDDFNEEDIERLIREDANTVVMNALSLASSGKPFKKSELILGSRLANRRADLDTIIEQAEELLRNVYNLELIQTGNKFLVCGPKTMPFRDELAALSASVTPQFSSLLGIVLSLIFLQKGNVDEEFLKDTMLKKLFPDIKQNPHPFFGNVDKLFAEFEQQMYLSKASESRSGVTKVFYRWGPRAEAEFDKRTIAMPVLSAMFGGSVPDSVWIEEDNEPRRL